MPKLNLETLINPTERQRDFLQAIADFDYVLYGGAAGGGKSYILRWWLVLYLCWLFRAKGLRNVQVMLACEDYPSLVDRHISKMRFEFPRELGELNQGTVKNFQLRPELGGGVIALRNLDDPSKYLSAEFAGIAVDELTRNNQRVFDFLRLRLRWPGVERPKFAGGSNPGGKGHAWVKKLWIEHEFPMELESFRAQFAFVQAKASDNPHLSPAYYEQLKTLPRDMAMAYAEGSWDIFAGQFFDLWTDALVTPSQDLKLEPWWPRWISLDWGYKHPSAVYWHAKDGDKVITYRELHESGLGETQLGEKIAQMTGEERIQDVFMSPDAFAKRTSQNTIAEQVGDILVASGIPRPVPADDDRIGGARLCYQMLQVGLGIISSACPALAKCLPTLIRDEDNIEDVLKVDGDDPYDAWRYGLKSMLSKGHKPLDVRVHERLAAIQQNRTDLGLPPQTDPTMVAMMGRKAMADERKKEKPVRLITHSQWQRPRHRIH